MLFLECTTTLFIKELSSTEAELKKMRFLYKKAGHCTTWAAINFSQLFHVWRSFPEYLGIDATTLNHTGLGSVNHSDGCIEDCKTPAPEKEFNILKSRWVMMKVMPMRTLPLGIALLTPVQKTVKTLLTAGYIVIFREERFSWKINYHLY